MHIWLTKKKKYNVEYQISNVDKNLGSFTRALRKGKRMNMRGKMVSIEKIETWPMNGWFIWGTNVIEIMIKNIVEDNFPELKKYLCMYFETS